MGNEETLSGSEVVPFPNVMRKVDFFGCPEGCLCFFIEFPDLKQRVE
jgi:hypothetical protein